MNEENQENKAKTSKNSKSSKNPVISVDTKLSTMLQYDQQGKLLTFNTDPDKFKELTKEEMMELSNENRMRYWQAREIYRSLKEEEEDGDNDWKHDISIDEQYASPTERLEVKNPTPGYRYYKASPSKMGRHEKKGYHIVPDSDPAYIGMSGKKKIGTMGKDELVLMRTPIENYKKLNEEKRKKRERMKGSPEQSGRDLGDSLGIETRDIE